MVIWWKRSQRWIRKNETIFVLIVSFFIPSAIASITLYLYLKGEIAFTAFLYASLGPIPFLVPVCFYFVRKRKETVLISLSSRYLLENDPGKVDELLGVLISTKPSHLSIDPVDSFFKTLQSLCKGPLFETRRRIAAALPALLRLDLTLGESLVQILRQDWDDKWKTDIRRRAVEALPSILHEDPGFVKESLRIFDGDELYTTIAAVEVLHSMCNKRHQKAVVKLFRSLLDEMEDRRYSGLETEAIRTLWTLLNSSQRDRYGATGIFREYRDSANVYVQICVARNVRRLCPGYPVCRKRDYCVGRPNLVLGFVNAFLDPERDHNVRRPMARQESLDCLLNLLGSPLHRAQVREVIWQLIKDDDAIIPTGTFDKIERILAIDRELGEQVIAYLATRGSQPAILERVQRVASREGITVN